MAFKLCVLLLTFIISFTDQTLLGITPKPSSGIRNMNTEPSKLDENDYDDFVPFKSDRHDSFDWRLLKAVLLQDSSNSIVSPFSVKLMLVLLLEAAGQETITQRELSSVLPNLKTAPLIRELYKKNLGSLKETNDNYEIKIGTKIFAEKFIQPRQRYAAIVQSYYGADIHNLDFQDFQGTTSLINNWCKNITNGNIEKIVTEDDVKNAVMLMINAIYFNGQWKYPFSLNETIEQPFFVTPTTQIRANFMTQTQNFYFYESTRMNAKILRLPYKGHKFSMTIILPNAKGGLDELIREIESDSLKKLQWLIDETLVKVTLPKFMFDYSTNLNDILKSLGIAEIFTENASLPGLSRGAGLQNRLKVSSIVQKSGLVVNEKGTEAYAASVVSIVNKFGGNTIEEFNANRPFIFLIEDETTGNLLFAGKVMDPTK